MIKRVLILSAATLTLLFSNCESQEMKYPATYQTQNAPVYSILALGDSYTIGESVPESERFPVQLRDSLMQHGISAEKLKIIARTGWTTDELMEGIEVSALDSEYDLVTLLIGVNNQYRGRSTENYREEFLQLLNKSVQFAGDDPERVIVISIPDWGVTPFASNRDREKISEEIDAFNTINLSESSVAGVHYVEITEISRRAVHDLSLLAGDSLHPSGKMYRLWVEKLLPVALEILAK